jgi:hypothetical protein
MDLLPDCRAQAVPAGVNRGVLGTWLPVFCANCGADGGLVPEENMTFIFYLCNSCAETHGQIAGTMLMPDEVFFARVAEAQLEECGRYLTPEEWERLDTSHPLVKLLQSK